MINLYEVTETNKMIEEENLDVRTITLGISLLDCIDSDLDRLNEKIYNKIYEAAKDLVKTGEEIELPLEKLITKKGTGAVYQLRFPKVGRYELVFRMSSTLGPLAQLPISVFLNNTLQQTVTINGTEGKIVEQTVILAIRQDGEKYMKLYFGESGIDMSRMFLRYVGKNDIESFRNE